MDELGCNSDWSVDHSINATSDARSVSQTRSGQAVLTYETPVFNGRYRATAKIEDFEAMSVK